MADSDRGIWFLRNRFERSRRMKRRFRREQSPPICWTERGSPEQKYFPTGLSRNKKKRWENGRSLYPKFVLKEKQKY